MLAIEKRFDLNVGITPEGNSPLPLNSFDNLGHDSDLQLGIYDVFKSKWPSRTEALLLSLIMSKPPRSVLAQARKSPDKDFSVVAGIVATVDCTRHVPQAIYLAPTQVVADQIYDLVKKMGAYMGLTAAVIAGRVESKEQLRSQVIVGTIESLPGLIFGNKLDTSHVRILVMDELDYYFLSQDASRRTQMTGPLKRLVDECHQAQTLVFYSAVGECIKELIPKVMNTGTCSVFFENEEEMRFGKTTQWKFLLDHGTKVDAVHQIIVKLVEAYPDPRLQRLQVIIFVNPETDPTELVNKLEEWPTRTPKLAREENKKKCLADFRDGFAMILITSQGFPVGFDISTPYAVIFYDLPVDETGEPKFDLYHHLASRAAKNPRQTGHVMCFLEDEDESQIDHMLAIEKRFDLNVEAQDWKPTITVAEIMDMDDGGDDVE